MRAIGFLVLLLVEVLVASCKRTTGPSPNQEKARGKCYAGTCQGN